MIYEVLSQIKKRVDCIKSDFDSLSDDDLLNDSLKNNCFFLDIMLRVADIEVFLEILENWRTEKNDS